MNPMKILDIIVKTYKNILGDNLVGIYLHGSLAMGCYTDSSDIDVIVLVEEPIDIIIKRSLIEVLIDLENLPKKGIEMSIVLEKFVKEFVYPTPFELHYSEKYKERYIEERNYICGGFADKDLAAHFTIIRYRGICLYGKEIEEVFGHIPEKYYIDSIMLDITNAREEIVENKIYIILNLCRVLYYLKENIISSKLEAGKWARNKVLQGYRDIIEETMKVYSGELSAMECNRELLMKYADYMMEEIERYKLRKTTG